MAEVTLCARDDLAPGEARRFDVEGHRIAVDPEPTDRIAHIGLHAQGNVHGNHLPLVAER